MLLPTTIKSILELIQKNKIEILSMKATNARDQFEILVRVKP
jgi:hypothetical protein